MKKQPVLTHSKQGPSSKYRHWSIMLVGDHGRVIPLRRFKGFLIFFFTVAVFTIVALVGISVLYVRQCEDIASMRTQIEIMNDQADKLKLERDLYLAKMVIRQERQTDESVDHSIKMDADGSENVDQSGENIVEEKQTPPAEEVVASIPSTPPDIEPIALAAMVKDLSIRYEKEKKAIIVKFKVYNSTKPKTVLSGYCVAILKQKDDPPIKWLTMPNVLLTNGQPAGNLGQAFRIRNYRTIEFMALNQEPPIDYNTASIFIFSNDGKQLYQNDFSFSINSGDALEPTKEPDSSASTAAPASLQHQPDPKKSIEFRVRPMASNPQSKPDTALEPSQPALPLMPVPVEIHSAGSSIVDNPEGIEEPVQGNIQGDEP